MDPRAIQSSTGALRSRQYLSRLTPTYSHLVPTNMPANLIKLFGSSSSLASWSPFPFLCLEIFVALLHSFLSAWHLSSLFSVSPLLSASPRLFRHPLPSSACVFHLHALHVICAGPQVGNELAKQEYREDVRSA